MKFSSSENSFSSENELSLIVDKIIMQINQYTTLNQQKYLKPNIPIVQFHKLIQNNIHISNNITIILHKLSSKISSLEYTTEVKKQIIKLLPEFFVPFSNNIELCYPYISRILTTIQNNVQNNVFSPSFLSEIFGEILVYSFQIGEEENIKNYEMFQGFCIYNMKQNKDSCQLCGVYCLKELIDHLDYCIKYEKIMKYLYEKIFLFIENENFNFKLNLLECLEQLIKKCGNEKFKQLANITLYKVLDFLVGSDREIIKRALNIILLLVSGCKGEIMSLKTQLVDCINLILKNNDDTPEIKESCMKLISLIGERKISLDTLKTFEEEAEEENVDIIQRKNEFVNRNNSNRNSNVNERTTESKKREISKKKNSKNKYDSIFNSSRNENFFQNLKINSQEIQIYDTIKPNKKKEEEKSKTSVDNNNNSYNNKKQFKGKEENDIEESSLIPNDKIIIPQNINQSFSIMLRQMKELSEKQIFLIDSLDTFQRDFHKTTAMLSNRISKLEKIVQKKLVKEEELTLLEQLNNSGNLREILNYYLQLNLFELNALQTEHIEESLLIINDNFEQSNTLLIKDIVAVVKKIIIGTKLNFSKNIITSLKKNLQLLAKSSRIMQDEELIELKLILSYFQKL